MVTGSVHVGFDRVRSATPVHLRWSVRALYVLVSIRQCVTVQITARAS